MTTIETAPAIVPTFDDEGSGRKLAIICSKGRPQQPRHTAYRADRRDGRCAVTVGAGRARPIRVPAAVSIWPGHALRARSRTQQRTGDGTSRGVVAAYAP
jgi:hypothetical protein